MRDAFIRALTEIAEADPRVVLVNGDLGFGVLTKFIAERGDQYINAGVAEQNMTAVACGMALEGAKAYTYSIGNFTTLRCLEQLRNDVCYHEADVVAVAIGGGFSYGQLGMSHFAIEDLAILRALPNMTVVAPSDPWQAYALTKQIHARGGPTYLRIDKDQAGLPDAAGDVTLGVPRTVREGTDAVIFSIGGILVEALAAAATLASEGVDVRIVDVHTLKPLDEAAIVAACDSGVIVTVEEHSVMGGLGSAIAEVCLSHGVATRAFARVGLKDLYPTVVGDQRYLRRAYGMDAAAIADAVREGLNRG
jgi:transketolase